MLHMPLHEVSIERKDAESGCQRWTVLDSLATQVWLFIFVFYFHFYLKHDDLASMSIEIRQFSAFFRKMRGSSGRQRAS